MPTPYTTSSGVKIGLMYQSKPRSLNWDEVAIQSMLLNSGKSHKNTYLIYAACIIATLISIALVTS